MNAAIRTHPAVIISIVVAATAVTACALVAIAWMMGWIPPRQPPPAKAAAAAPAKHATDSAIALLPGESLVSADEIARAAPAPATSTAAPAAPQAAPPKPHPVAPQYTRAERAPQKPATRTAAAPAPKQPPANPRGAVTSYERSARTLCVNCGTVMSITAYEEERAWDVHVRFEDGSHETLRYRVPPGLRIGQRVLLEEGRLVPN
jgi:hypothetical protein